MIQVEIRDAISDLKIQTQEVVAAAGRFWFETTVDLNPKLTGFSSSNWIPTFGGTTEARNNANRDPAGSYAPAAAGIFIEGWVIGRGDIFLNNNTDYILNLEAGSSPQAPAGMLGPALLATEARFRSVTAQIRSPVRFTGNINLGTIDRQLVDLDRRLATIERNARRARTGLDQAAGQAPFLRIGAPITRLDRLIDRGLGGVGGVRNALLAVGAGTFAASIVRTAIEFESAERILTTVLGNSDDVAAAMAFTSDEAGRLGLDVLESQSQFAKLVAATRGTALQGAQTQEIFSGVAEASAQLGLSAEDTGGIFTALTQIISKGSVQAEELRGQLGERLVGAFQIAARSIGVTTEELSDLLKTGQLSAGEFLPPFIEALRDTVATDAATRIDSTQADLQRFGNALTQIRLLIAQGGFVDGIVRSADALADAASDPGLRDVVTTASAFAGQTLVAIASNIEIFLAGAAAVIATRIASVLVQTATAFIDLANNFLRRTGWGLIATAVAGAVGAIAAGITGTQNTALTSLADTADGIINAVIGVSRGLGEAVQGGGAILIDTVIAGLNLGLDLLNEFLNGILDSLAGQAVQAIFGEVERFSFEIPRQTTNFRTIGDNIGREVQESFEGRWARNKLDRYLVPAEPPAVQDLVVTESVINDHATAVAALPETLPRLSSVVEADREAAERLGFETVRTAAAFDATTARMEQSLDIVRAAVGGLLGLSEEEAANVVRNAGTLLDRVFESGDSVLARGGEILSEWTGTSREELVNLFGVAGIAFEEFGVQLEDVVGGTATSLINIFARATEGNIDALSNFFSGAFGQFTAFVGLTSQGATSVNGTREAQHVSQSGAAALSVGNSYGNHGEAVTGNLAQQVAATGTKDVAIRAASQTTAETSAAGAQQVASTVAGVSAVAASQSSRTAQVGAAAVQSVVNSAAAGGNAFATSVGTALQTGAQVFVALPSASGALGALQGVGLAAGDSDTTGGQIAGTIDVDRLFGPPTPAQDALGDFGEAVGRRFGSLLGGGVIGLGFGLGGVPGAVGGSFLAGQLADFTAGVGQQVGFQLGNFLDSITGGAASQTINILNNAVQGIEDFFGVDVIGGVSDFLTEGVFSIAGDFAAEIASNIGSAISDFARNIFGGGGSDNDDPRGPQFSSNDIRDSGSFRTGGVFSRDARRRLGLAPDDVPPGFIFLELKRFQDGNLGVEIPDIKERDPPQKRIVANLEGAERAARARLRAYAMRRGWLFEENPRKVRGALVEFGQV